jgi:benzoate 4-monooxygenase
LDKYRREHTAEQTETDCSIIGHLVKSPYPSDKERVADVTVFMIAGHETTANQASWLIIELSRHPLVVAKIRDELDALFPAGTVVDFTPQTLSQLHYLTMVIKEGMRLWAVTPIGSNRVVSKDIHYKEFIIPKGATVGIGQFSLLRSGIDKPDEFIPERWAEDDPDAAVLREMNVPFSVGKRGCVGQNLALLELKLVLSSLFYSYDFELISEVTEFFFLSLKPQNANFKVTRRVQN